MELSALKKAVEDYFGDTARPAEETMHGLEEVSGQIEGCIETLAEQLDE